MRDLSVLAWRNLGRNRRRSLITGSALAFGMALCIAAFGITDGLNAQMLRSLTRYELGHVQVHPREVVEEPESRALLAAPEALLAAAEATPGVVAAAPRLYGFGLLSGPRGSTGVQLVGVEPSRETRVTEFREALTEGAYLDETPTPWPAPRALTEAERARDRDLTQGVVDAAALEIDALGVLGASEAASADADEPARPGDQRANGPDDEATRREESQRLALAESPPPERPPRVLLGTSLAKHLGAGVGERLFLSAATLDGGTESVFVEVGGLYETGTQLHDRHRVTLHRRDLGRLFRADESAQEISVLLGSASQSGSVATALQQRLGADALRVRSWEELRPDVDAMFRLHDVSTAIMTFIIFFVASLGVVNTALMSVFERTREFGMLKAIGMSERRIVGLILLETLWLVGLASLVGLAVGLALDAFLVLHGIDLSGVTAGVSVAGLGLQPVMRGEITVEGVLLPVAILGLTSLGAALFPALRAARLQPAVGMRET